MRHMPTAMVHGGGGVGGVAGELAEKSAARKMHQSPKHLVSVTDDF